MSKLSAIFLSLFLASEEASFAKTTYGFINGGISEQQNLWLHEQDILSFKNTLFGNNQSTILSASGPDAKFIPVDGKGVLRREMDGYPTLKASAAGPQVKTANLENVQKLYAGIGQSKPEQAVIVYGDHGAQNGLALWDGEILSPEEHFKLQKTVPKETLLRTIHIQCFAGSLLVDQLRKIPSDPMKLSGFIDQYYPAKQCGLALSRHDEMGQYYTDGTTWQTSPWTNLLKKKPASLNKIKEHLNKDKNLVPLTVLTSDYYLEDMAAFLCGQFKTGQPIIVCEGNEKSPVTALQNQLIKELCGQPQYESLTQKIDHEFQTNSVYTNFLSYWTAEYIKMKNPTWDKQMGLVDYLTYLQWQVGNGTEKERSAARIEKEKMESQLDKNFVQKYQAEKVRLSAVGADPEFDAFFRQNCTKDWINKEPQARKIVNPEYAEKFFKNPVTSSCKEGMELANKNQVALQSQRKMQLIGAMNKRQALMEQLFKDPNFKSAKERYGQIKFCENSAL